MDRWRGIAARHSKVPALLWGGLLCGALLCAAVGNATAQRQKAKPKPAAKPAVAVRVILPQALQASGLLDTLAKDFEKRHRLAIKFVPANLKAAVKLAMDGKADAVILDHFPTAANLIKSTRAQSRLDVMYTDLMIVGPANDPAGIAGMVSVITALRAVARSESLFISRGDGSTTYRIEHDIWRELNLKPSPSVNAWYTRTGADMRTTLGLAAAKNAYTIVDRATWLRFRARRRLVVMVDHDPRLMLRYSVLVLNPKEVAGADAAKGKRFADWITSSAVQSRIARFVVQKQAPFSPHVGLQR